MKKPEISTEESDSDLVGSNETSSWLRGHNCVYRDSSVAEYRVSIKTPTGWKSYGHFHNLETATYVANIAILVEGCEERYVLNKMVGNKNKDELAKWRSQSRNLELERFAREKYKHVRVALDVLQEEERSRALKHAEECRIQEEKLAEERRKLEATSAQERRIRDAKTSMILGLNNADLVKFIKSTKMHDPFYDIAMSEAVRRHKALGLPRVT